MLVINVTREEHRQFKRMREYAQARGERNAVPVWVVNNLGDEALEAARKGATMLQRRALKIGVAVPRTQELTDEELEEILLKEFGDGEDTTVYEEEDEPQDSWKQPQGDGGETGAGAL